MKKTTDELYAFAREYNIPVDENCPESIVSMSVRLPSGLKVIGLSKFEKPTEDAPKQPYTKLECFAHEMGHCMTDSFYVGFSPLEKRSKHEYRAEKWAINYLIPFDALCQAVQEGNHELWQLAEYFDVGEPFIEKAITYHAQHGHVVELRAKF